MSDYKTFETERLFIRPTSLEDAEFILKLLNTPKWIANIGDRKVQNLEDSTLYIKTKITSQLVKLGFSNYTVIRKADGTKLGSCGLYERVGLDVVDIGFAFLPEFEGQGYGTESAARILKAGFETFNQNKISAITTKENIASQKLLEKLGLTFIKIIRIPNDEEDLMYYEIERQKTSNS